MTATYHVICSNALPQNAGRIDSKFCVNSDALYQTLLELKPNKHCDIDFDDVSKEDLIAFVERKKIICLNSADYRSITVLYHAPEKTIMFVSFVDNPHYAYAKLSNEHLEVFGDLFHSDPLLSYRLIFEVDAKAWFVIGNDIQQCKVIATTRYLTESSKYLENTSLSNYDIFMKGYVDNVFLTLSQSIEPMESQDFADKYFQARLDKLSTAK